MNKFIKHIIFVMFACFLTLNSTPSYAFLTLDPGKGIGKIFTSISTFAGNIQDKIADLQNHINSLKWVQNGKNAVQWLKETHDANAKMLQKYKRKYNELTNTDAYEMAEKTTQIISLENQIKNLEQEKEDILKAQDKTNEAKIAQISGEIKALEDNNAIYQAQGENQAQIDANNEQIKALQKELEELETNSQASEDIAMLDAQINDLEDQKESLEKALADQALDIAEDFLDDVKAIAKSMDFNFVDANEELTSDAIITIKQNREEEEAKVIKEVFARSISARSVLGYRDAFRGSFTKQSNGIDEVSGNLAMLIEAKIDDMIDTLYLAEMYLLEMKLKTSIELADLDQYKIEDGTKNMEVFDLEDYVFDFDDYKSKQLAKQKLSINRFERNVENAINKLERVDDQLLKGGLIDDVSNTIDRALDRNNAGSDYRSDGDPLSGVHSEANQIENSLKGIQNDAVNLFR